MSGTPALLAAVAAALAAWPPGKHDVTRRLRSLSAGRASPRRKAPRPEGTASVAARAWLLAAAAGATTALLLGGAGGAATGLALALAAALVLQRRGRTSVLARAVPVAELPVAADLLAVCLLAGLPVSAAVAAVAGALGGSVGDQLSAVAALQRLGADPRRAWSGAAPELAGLGRVLVRAGESGSTVVPALIALAADARAAATAEAQARVRRAEVWVLAPLGACFLPAFLCLGVVPLVLGIAHQVLR